MKNTSFKRMDIRELVDLPRWIEIFCYPLIWLVNVVLLKSKGANEIIESGNKKKATGCDFMAHASDFLGYRVMVRGFDRMPQKGAAVVPSNHPGGGDLCAIFKALKMMGRKDLKILINPLVNFSPIREMVIPITKDKKQMIEKMNTAFQEGNLFPIFPAGRDSRMRDDVIQDDPWKGTFVSYALKHNTPIIPIHISGGNSKWFYMIARIRKNLKISFNIEQFFLIRELFLARGKKVWVTVGKPIDPGEFGIDPNDRKKTDELAAIIREYVYMLPKNPNADFNALYNQVKTLDLGTIE